MTEAQIRRTKKFRAKQRIWKSLGICYRCGKAPIGRTSACDNCYITLKGYWDSPQHKLWHKNDHANMRKAALDAYGGPVCHCCGENTYEFLSIDHINNDGGEHRKSLRAKSIYRWLKNNNYPPGFRVLCHNCNIGRYICGGMCPHIRKPILSWGLQ